MKKNLKIVSLAAAALLAVSPVVASAANVNADTGLGGTTTSASTNTNTNVPFFSYDFGAPVLNNGTLPDIDASGFKTVQNVTDAINNHITFSPNGSNGANRKEDISNAEVIRQLNNQGIKTNKPSKPNTKLKGDAKLGEYTFNVPANFSIKLLHTISHTGYTVTVPFYNNASGAPTVDATAPVFNVKVGDTTTKAGDNAYYTIAAGSNFNPISFTEMDGKTVTFSADQASNNTTAASVSVASNSDNVDTSQTGRFFTVRLTATNQAGKTSNYSYTVLVVANGLQPVHANGQSSVPTFSIYGNEVSTNSTTFKDGQQVYVGNTTRTVNKVSYTKVSTKSKADADAGNLWIQTSALATNSSTTTNEQSETHRVMVDSKAYDKNGNYLGHDYAYNTNIDIVPTVVNINGKTYYKVAGKDEYVRVTNITGTLRRVRHNAYVYWSSYRRNWTGKIKYYRGQYVHTYGAAMTFRNGKRYYRIDGCSPSNKRYLKVANF